MTDTDTLESWKEAAERAQANHGLRTAKRMESLRDAIVIVNEAMRTAVKAQDRASYKLLLDAADNLYGQYADVTFAHFGLPTYTR